MVSSSVMPQGSRVPQNTRLRVQNYKIPMRNHQTNERKLNKLKQKDAILIFFASSGINLTMFSTHKDAIFVNFCSSTKIYRSADTPLLLLSYQRFKNPLFSYFYFKTIISLQRVVGFSLIPQHFDLTLFIST